MLELWLGHFWPERPALLLLCNAATPWKTGSPQVLKHTDLLIFLERPKLPMGMSVTLDAYKCFLPAR